MAQTKQSKQGCAACTKIKADPRNQVVLLIDSEDFMRAATGEIAHTSKAKRKELKREKVDTFLKFTNALLNEGWGFIAIHTLDGHLLGLFDEAVDKLMLGLVADETFFHDNFERFYYDTQHIIFRIIPQKPRLLSTMVFNTKVLTDTGLDDPSHGQIRNFILHSQDEKPAQKFKEQLFYTFKLNTEVDVRKKTTGTQVIFQEDMETQAKKVPTITSPNFISKLVSFCIFNIRLNNYVSAFSKLPRGGSIFLGLYEEKTEVPKWKVVEKEELTSLLAKLSGPDKEYTLYKDLDEDDLYHIMSTQGQAPTKNQQRTGRFKAQGIVLRAEEKDKLREELIAGVLNNTLRVPFGEEDGDYISVLFHDVEGTGTESCRDRYVVEVRVEKYRGVWYTDPTGPVAYELKQTEDEHHFERIDVKSWHDLNKRLCSEMNSNPSLVQNRESGREGEN